MLCKILKVQDLYIADFYVQGICGKIFQENKGCN